MRIDGGGASVRRVQQHTPSCDIFQLRLRHRKREYEQAHSQPEGVTNGREESGPFVRMGRGGGGLGGNAGYYDATVPLFGEETTAVKTFDIAFAVVTVVFVIVRESPPPSLPLPLSLAALVPVPAACLCASTHAFAFG